MTYLAFFTAANTRLESIAFQIVILRSSRDTFIIRTRWSFACWFRTLHTIIIIVPSFVIYQALLAIYRSVDQLILIRARHPIINMRQQLQLLLVTLAVGLSLAQTSDDGQYTGWGESTTQECDGCDEYTSTTWYPSYTTWTSCYVYGTVTITVTSTVPCDTTTWDSWTTTTTTESVCADCEPVTTYCPPDCGSVTTTECPEGEVGCNGQGEYSTQVEQGDPQPYSTMTYEPEPGSTVVVVMYPGTTTAASGQTGVVQVISSGAEAGKRWGDEMWIGCVLAVAGVLGIVLL